MSGQTLKMDRQTVTSSINKIDIILEAAESDSRNFDRISENVFTNNNCESSNKVKALKNKNDIDAPERKKTINNLVQNLKTAKDCLNRYANELELT